MLAKSDQVRLLLQRYYAGSIEEREVAELGELLQNGQYDALMEEVMLELAANTAPMHLDPAYMNRMVVRLQETTAPPKVRRMFGWKAAAAAVLVLGLGAASWWALRTPQPPVEKVARYGGDALPGGNKATLTLGNGSVLDLNNAANGQLAAHGGSNAVKTGQGALEYGQTANPVQYHTLTTPRGGQYQLTLADGTVVWLNAGSALRYPTTFGGKERAVELSGEAYFDVAASAEKPFVVKMPGGTDILVLGTGFNVKAYAGEPDTRTTLVEGAVLVRNGTAMQTLKPGQEAIATGSQLQLNAQADVEAATAWKQGKFLFRDTQAEEVMKQLSRWYDVDIVYEKGIVKEYFNGTISRSVPLSEVLELLELTKLVHFTIKGNKVTVSP